MELERTGAGLRVQVLDPSAWTPPYDRALCAALARAGAQVELVTTRFAYGPVPPAEAFRVTERFYRRQPGRPGSRLRAAAKLAQHPFDMRAVLRGKGLGLPDPDVRHMQWLAVPHLDARSIARSREPVVLTAHDILPREPRPGQVRALRAAYREADAIIVHSRHGHERLVSEAGVEPERARVIPHGAFEHLVSLSDPAPLDPAIERWAGGGPLVLFFGLLRPYKGIEVLLEAWRRVADPEARLLIAGMPRMPLEGLRERADERVRIEPRFVPDREIPALFRRADLLVLPYREIDQSGVLYTALAFGRACVLTRVGGFTEIANEHGVGRLVEPGEADELAAAMAELLADEEARGELERAASRAAAGAFSWDAAAAATLELYRELLNRQGQSR